MELPLGARLATLCQHLQLAPQPAAPVANAAAAGKRPRVAAICTTWHPQSHADVIVWKLLKGTTTDEGYRPPQCDVVSMYLDQINTPYTMTEAEAEARTGGKHTAFTAAASAGDGQDGATMDNGVGIAKALDIPVYTSIKAALMNGTDTLDVDAVVLIGEHGDYPVDELGRHMYPRKALFEQIAGVMAQTGKVVPVFNDKHFSYDIDDGLWMWNRAQQLGIPLFAGSSLVVCWRKPYLEHPIDCAMEDALIVSGGGPDGYHTLEALQCMVERRAGGEKGVAAVTVLQGAAVWESMRAGRWSEELAMAAIGAITDAELGDSLERLMTGTESGGTATLPPGQHGDGGPCVFLIEYCDGFTATMLGMGAWMVPRTVDDGEIYGDWGYAARVGGKVEACEFFLQNTGAYGHFSYLVRNVEAFLATGVPPYNAARTVLTTGIADASLKSVAAGNVRVETPYLHIPYASYATLPARPTGERPSGPMTNLDAPDDNWSKGSQRWLRPLGAPPP